MIRKITSALILAALLSGCYYDKEECYTRYHRLQHIEPKLFGACNANHSKQVAQ
jgi:hypothetical protein